MGERDRSVGELLGALGRAAFWSFALVASSCAFFYAAQMLFVPGYRLDLAWAAANVAFLGGATLAIMTLPGPAWGWALLCWATMLFPTVVVSSYIGIYRELFNFNVLYFVWQTNPGEASEFIHDALSRFPMLPAWGLACAVLPALCLRPLVRSARALKATGAVLRVGALLAGLLIVFWGAYIGDARRWNYVSMTYATALKFRYDLNFVRTRSAMAPELLAGVDMRPALPEGERETYVVVVGESASRHHWGLYGYPRDTTPYMSARAASGDVWALRNVCATAIGTTESLFRALTFLDQGDGPDRYSCSLVDVANRAGFETWWLTNNATLAYWETQLDAFTKNAGTWRATEASEAEVRSMQKVPDELRAGDAEIDVDLTHDGALLPWLDEALADPAPKKLVFLHLKGSHGKYRYRYPPEFAVFDGTGGIDYRFVMEREEQEAEMRETIDAYDDSILYTDWILEQVVRRLEAAGGRALMIHFSDHGDEVFDWFPFYGRDVGRVSKYPLDVPFIVWASPEWRAWRDAAPPDGYLDRPMRLDDTIHAAMDLMGLRTDLLDATRSPFSDRWAMRPRWAGGTLYLLYPPIGLTNAATAEAEMDLAIELMSSDGLAAR